MKYKVVQKAYKAWVHSMLPEYDLYSDLYDKTPDSIEITYANNISDAKRKIDIRGEKNFYGEAATWIDIKCKRVKRYDKVEYKGTIWLRYQCEANIEYEKKKVERLQSFTNLNDSDYYYVQDARRYVGNSVSWWALNDNGYTTDISKAQKYTKDEILKRGNNWRETDIIWNAKHVEANIKQHVDIQYLHKDYAV